MEPGKQAEHDAAVSGMFGRIVSWYDLLNRLLSLGIDQSWRRELAQNVRTGKKGIVLDLAAGTLDVAMAIRRLHPDVQIPALDLCHPMLLRGSRKLGDDSRQKIFPVTANAKNLPLPDASVDCITMAFGIRNILPREAAFAEMLRVLQPGGRACILEFGSGQERIWGGIYNLYLRHVLPRVGRVFSKNPKAYDYLSQSIHDFPPAQQLVQDLRSVGFARAWYKKLTSGIVYLHIAEKAT
jgi:demethylmenaquinone methyltransferase/2-methoxy-6-polyprenyl-1,4-benzoquinol methylase